ncbi:hypothetical protein MTHERMOG20_20630 [Moorella thermoacetica]|uniref:Uncharacterized protein n=1 Tax=Moorella thermoacetica (strain ATCC 39073 / JCM 9320) TaxID=264732 RepID=Q2RKG0_MOOTA|nr:hypothetical protein [Moorella thermoacetica]AKX93509.1 hypothetical protein MOTHE_c07050 [Moorella thermoacetica]AKX96156.1 hypothetical protein MOTHA_c07990 [Moorella thermoacetica]OIQ55368.1 hypothetical protein MOCA_19400 [Moorella thermoacetica]QCZ99966.1 hypothetical protein MothHH_00813 [Moorella thermoacetica]TYL07380.1 hypothetical protein MOOCA_21450 [Moorella thermoacetica]
MQLLLDGVEIPLPDNNIEQLLQVIADLTRRVGEKGRVVARAVVDGKEIADVEFFLQARVYPQPQTISIITMTPEELLAEALNTAASYLPRMLEDIHNKAERLVRGENIGVEAWAGLLEGLEWLNSLLGSVLQQKQFDPVKQREGSRLAGDFRATVQEMMAAWEQGDAVSLADVLEYRLATLVEGCLAFFNAVYTRGDCQ